jgi:hypothetical protein
VITAHKNPSVVRKRVSKIRFTIIIQSLFLPEIPFIIANTIRYVTSLLPFGRKCSPSSVGSCGTSSQSAIVYRHQAYLKYPSFCNASISSATHNGLNGRSPLTLSAANSDGDGWYSVKNSSICIAFVLVSK